jgi:hypothetical protein
MFLTKIGSAAILVGMISIVLVVFLGLATSDPNKLDGDLRSLLYFGGTSILAGVILAIVPIWLHRPPRN